MARVQPTLSLRMRQIFIFVLCLFWTVSGFTQTTLIRKENTFQKNGGIDTTATYGGFFKELMDFFLKSKATPGVAGVLRKLEPCLNQPLTKQNKNAISRILDELESLKEPNPKTREKVSILQTRVALGSFVSNLRTEIDEGNAIESGDTTVADGTEAMLDTIGKQMLPSGPVIVTKSDESPWIWWIISGISIMAAVGIGYLYQDEKKKRKKIDRQMLNTSNQASQSYIKMQQLEKQVPQLIEKAKEYEKAVNKYKKALEDKEEENKDLKQQLKAREIKDKNSLAIEQTPSTILPTKVTQEQPEFEETSRIEPVQRSLVNKSSDSDEPFRAEHQVFYFSAPNKDGSFRDVRGVQFDPSQSLYQVKLTGSLEADFKFVDDPELVSEALRYPETFLDPVCNYIGGIQYGARRIITVANGKLSKASLDSDRWELLHKAVITFE